MFKLSIDEFNKYIDKLRLLKNNKGEYIRFQNELLSYDLSDIPFSSWEGLSLYSNDVLDLSNTHANIDFALLEDIDYKTIRLHGCNIKNIELINFDDQSVDTDFKEKHPELFLNDLDLDKSIVDAFYNGTLNFGQINFYYEDLKDKNIMYGIRNSRDFIEIGKVLPPEDFLEKIPQGLQQVVYYKIVTTYRESIQTGNNKALDELRKLDLDELITESIKDEVNKPYYNADLQTIYEYSKYLPLSDLIKNPDIVSFIEHFGFENIIRFNNETNYSLEYSEDNFSKNLDETLLYYLATIYSSQDYLSKNKLDSYDDFLKGLSSIVHEMRINSDFSIRYISSKIPSEFARAFKEDFIDRELVFRLLNDISENEKRNIYQTLNTGINLTISSLVDILYKYPVLKEALKGKKIITYPHNGLINNFYEELDEDIFFEICIKYGSNFNSILNTAYPDEIHSLIKTIRETKDIENNINDYIYKRINYRNMRIVEIRELPDSFKKAHPELYLPENAPDDLVDVFYGDGTYGELKRISSKDLYNHPEWIPYLLNVDLSKCFSNIFSNYVENDFQTDKLNLYSILRKKMSQQEVLEFIVNYGKYFPESFSYITFNNNGTKEEWKKQLLACLYKEISFNYIKYSPAMPEEFKNLFPDLFLSEDAPLELKDLYYGKKLDVSIIKAHPEWDKYFKDKNVLCGLNNEVRNFALSAIENGIGSEEILYYIRKYGEYLFFCRMDFNLETSDVKNSSIEQREQIIKKQIIKAIYGRMVMAYNEDLKPILGEEYPELFLSEDAPDVLKKFFYNYDHKTPLSFEVLRNNKEWLPYLKGKNVLLSLLKKGIARDGLRELFEKLGTEESLKIGIKNPSAVMSMLASDKIDELIKWYRIARFVPCYPVMKNFDIDEISEFLMAGKKWSMLMKLSEFTNNDETTEALLKASKCFGVFDHDDDGFRKTISLFTSIPKVLTSSDFQKLHNSIENKLYLFEFDEKEALTALQKASILKRQEHLLLDESYVLQSDGKYHLRIDVQHNKDTIKQLRELMILNDVYNIFTPEKAHQLFGGFDMKYEPDFRDFILDNLDEILEGDYISYISSMQKQWREIKVFNSNRTLTLDLAISYIKSNVYENVETGNERLAEVSSIAGYSQSTFDELQKIYSYSKTRTFSDIPRIENSEGLYRYEILRLDDPLALAIGTLTNCCQELNNAAESSMEHSAVSEHGRIFLIRDNEGNFIAQSWVWRNKNVVCFDNIEIPHKALKRARESGNDDFAKEVYKIYVKAAHELMEKDNKALSKLKDEGIISAEEYEKMKISKVTVGEGYNDIKEVLIENAPEDISEVAKPIRYVSPITGDEYLYTSDSRLQYILAGETKEVEDNVKVPLIYHDDFVLLDDSNAKLTDSLVLQKLEIATKKDEYSGRVYTEENGSIVSDIAFNYQLPISKTRIVMNNNFAIIFALYDDRIIIGDLLYNFNIKTDNPNDNMKDCVLIQMNLALKQIIKSNMEIDLSRINDTQKEVFNLALNYNINNERSTNGR